MKMIIILEKKNMKKKINISMMKIKIENENNKLLCVTRIQYDLSYKKQPKRN